MASLRLRSSVSWIPFGLLVMGAAACGPTYAPADDDSGAGGTDGTDDSSDGSDGAGGSSDGSGGDEGTGGDEPSGGSDSGGSDNSGGSESSGGSDGSGGGENACSENNECVAAADMDQPCYSAACAAPVAVTQSELERNPCLVRWEERSQTTIPEECAGSDKDMVCPAISCELPPPCVSASCSDLTGACEVELCPP